MRCYTKRECEEWLSGRSRELPTQESSGEFHRETMKDHRAFPFAHWFAKYSTFESGVMLWITEWGIWTTSENYHLYYKLRSLYGDTRLLHEAPGHYFLQHEMEDLATFLQIAILNGWGGHILTEADYVNAFFSHDEYVDFYAKTPGNLSAVKQWFSPL